MATFFHDIFICLAIFVTCFVAAPCTASASNRPGLRLSKTEDLHLMCNMAGVFPDLTAHITIQAMQIQFTADQEANDFKTLATMEKSSHVRASPFLSNSGRAFKVTGAMPSNVSQWWLKLVLVGVGGNENGAYSCTVQYSIRKEQEIPFSWQSHWIAYFPGSNASVITPGFELSERPGLDMLCEYSIPGQNVNVIKLDFKAVSPSSVTNTTLAGWSANNSGFCPPRVLCHPRTFVANYLSLKAHLFNLTCDDQTTYQCSVTEQESGASASVSSDQEKISLDFCMDTTKPADKPSIAVIVTPVVVVVVIIVLCSVGFIQWNRSRKGNCYKLCSGGQQGQSRESQNVEIINMVTLHNSPEGVRLPTVCTDPSPQIPATGDGANTSDYEHPLTQDSTVDTHPQITADVHQESLSDDVNPLCAPTNAAHIHPERQEDCNGDNSDAASLSSVDDKTLSVLALKNNTSTCEQHS